MLRKIFKFLLFILDNIVRLIAFVFVRLGLWVAVIFLVASIIFCAVKSIAIEGDTLTIIITLTIVIAVISMYVTMLLVERKKKGGGKKSKSDVERQGTVESRDNDLKKEAENRAGRYAFSDEAEFENLKITQAEQGSENQSGNGEKSFAQYESVNENGIKQETAEQVMERQAREREESEQNEFFRQKYFVGETTLQDDYHRKLNEEQSFQNKYGQSETATNQSLYKEEQPLPNEKPLIFATRKDPSIMILEYSDRLMFYKKTNNGPQLITTEYKSKTK